MTGIACTDTCDIGESRTSVATVTGSMTLLRLANNG